jgi:Glucodextranase, domain B
MSHNTFTPKKLIMTLSILFLIAYAVFNSRFLITGPEVTILGLDSSGKNIQTASRNFSLQGTATHSAYIAVNNRPISVDELGNFNEKLLLSNGVSIIDIYARDKFGKEVRKKIDVVYAGEDDSTALSALDIATSSNVSSSTPDVIVLRQDEPEDASLSSSFVEATSTESVSTSTDSE